jgi:hypothetical protein
MERRYKSGEDGNTDVTLRALIVRTFIYRRCKNLPVFWGAKVAGMTAVLLPAGAGIHVTGRTRARRLDGAKAKPAPLG